MCAFQRTERTKKGMLVKNEQIKKATIRFETVPGLQAQVDWKESMRLVNKYGEVFEINIFLRCVLVC